MTKNAGFTLIELLVVVLIIGILSAVALPQYNLTVAKARFTQAKVSAEAIRKAQEVFFLENGRYSVDLTELVIQPTGCSILNNGAWCWNEHYTCFVNDTHRDGSGNLVPTVYCSMKNPDVSYYAKPPSAVRQCFAGKDDALANKLCKNEGGTFTALVNGTNRYNLQ